MRLLRATIVVGAVAVHAGPPAAPPPGAAAAKLKPEWSSQMLVQLLESAECPVWSPCGKWLAAIKRDSAKRNSCLVVLELSTGHIRSSEPFTSSANGNAEIQPAWSGDGKTIFLAVADRLVAFAVTEPSTLPARDLARLPECFFARSIVGPSANGALAVYGSVQPDMSANVPGHQGQDTILLYDAAGNLLNRLENAAAPCWLPDSQQLLYRGEGGLSRVAATAKAVPETVLSVAEFSAATDTAGKYRDDGGIKWFLTPIQAFADGAMLFSVDAVMSRMTLGSRPNGEIAFWPDAKRKTGFLRLGETACNPVGSWVLYLPIYGGEKLVRLERGKPVVELIEVRTGAKREIALPRAINGKADAIEYGQDMIFAAPHVAASAFAAIPFQDSSTVQAAANGELDEAQLKQALAEAIQAGDLSVMNRTFNGLTGVMVLNAVELRTTNVPLTRAAGPPSDFAFQPNGKLMVFCMSWRDPSSRAVWLFNPDGESERSADPKPALPAEKAAPLLPPVPADRESGLF